MSEDAKRTFNPEASDTKPCPKCGKLMILRPETPHIDACWRCVCGYTERVTRAGPKALDDSTLRPELLHFGNLRSPVRTIFRIVLADGTVLELPLKDGDLMDDTIPRIEGFFGELWAVPGVREVFEKHGVVVRTGSSPKTEGEKRQ